MQIAVAPKGYLLVFGGNKLLCSMLDGCCFSLEDSTVVFHLEEVLCDGFCTSVGYNKPATSTMFSFGSVCKAANATGACFYDVRVECVFVFLCERSCRVGDSVGDSDRVGDSDSFKLYTTLLYKF